MKPCDVHWLGKIDYVEAWDLQKSLAAKRLAGEIPDTLLLLEHPPTLTIGRFSDNSDIFASPEKLKELGIAVVHSDRGGKVTYHGPGQLVGYPILNLNEKPHSPDLHKYFRDLEQVLISTLRRWDIFADRFPGFTGVWVDRDTDQPTKIAALGIKTSRWITQHGFALNICPDLSHFSYFVPCGITEFGVTSVSKILGQETPLLEFLDPIVEEFSHIFRLDCQLSTLCIAKR